MTQVEPSQQLPLAVQAHDHIQGRMDATVVLVEYCDYRSPDCSQAYLILKELQRRLGEQLCFVFRYFPFTQDHAQAHKAALAAEAAAAQGKFWEMHDILFEYQQAQDDASLVEYAIELKLDIYQFLREMTERVYVERVQEDIRSGISSGVESIPTCFINGIRYTGTWNLESLIAAIEQASH